MRINGCLHTMVKLKVETGFARDAPILCKYGTRAGIHFKKCIFKLFIKRFLFLFFKYKDRNHMCAGTIL